MARDARCEGVGDRGVEGGGMRWRGGGGGEGARRLWRDQWHEGDPSHRQQLDKLLDKFKNAAIG